MPDQDKAARSVPLEVAEINQDARGISGGAGDDMVLALRLDWRPIDTAPKTGEPIVLWPPSRKGVITCGAWDDDRYSKRPRPFWNRLDQWRMGFARENPPTHWAPIPAGPEVAP